MAVADVWTSPDHFPIRVNPWNDAAVLVPLTPRLYRRLAFLDDRFVPMAASWDTSLRALADAAPADVPRDRRPAHAIFHVAFCGSTLISRCLDRLGTLVLKEPFPFHELGFMKRHDPLMHDRPRDWQTAFDLVMRLLARTYPDTQASVIKPTDASTHLIEDVLAHAPDAGALFLYVDLETFLLSILGDPIRRGFARERLEDLSVLFPDHALFCAATRRTLTDAESAACLWLLHRQIYADFAERNPDARCRSLDFAAFLDDPAPALGGVARLFGIRTSARDLDEAVTAESGTHAKAPDMRFTRADRKAALQAVSDRYRDEVVEGLAWADRARSTCCLASTLPRPLEIP